MICGRWKMAETSTNENTANTIIFLCSINKPTMKKRFKNVINYRKNPYWCTTEINWYRPSTFLQQPVTSNFPKSWGHLICLQVQENDWHTPFFTGGGWLQGCWQCAREYDIMRHELRLKMIGCSKKTMESCQALLVAAHTLQLPSNTLREIVLKKQS